MPRRLTSPSAADDTSLSPSISPSILVTILLLAVAVIIFAALYLLLSFFRRRRNHRTAVSPLSPTNIRHVSPEIDSLPLFTYDRLTTKNVGDCAVCLSKFERNDLLRFLPLRCHAFHAKCIDTWLKANSTGPLCRSSVFVSDLETSTVSTNSGERSSSLGGSFDYVIDGVGDTSARDVLAAEVRTRSGRVGSWRDYLSSRAASFRGSGRFFTGSSRRSTLGLPVGIREDELALGDEIREYFSWLSEM